MLFIRRSNTGDSRTLMYWEVPVQIANGRNGEPSVTVGTVTMLPATLAVSRNGQTTHAQVLGWGCRAGSEGSGHDGDPRGS